MIRQVALGIKPEDICPVSNEAHRFWSEDSGVPGLSHCDCGLFRHWNADTQDYWYSRRLSE